MSALRATAFQAVQAGVRVPIRLKQTVMIGIN
jgi:hypothetical protein